MKLSLRDGEVLKILCSQINTMEAESGNRLLNVPLFTLLSTGGENKQNLGCKCEFLPKYSREPAQTEKEKPGRYPSIWVKKTLLDAP